MHGFQFFVNSFVVRIQFDRLECIKEYDESGHSEPYMWPAFLRGDAGTLLNQGKRIEVAVPFENESGRGLFGQAGKDVKPGDVIPIPADLGLFTTRLDTLRLLDRELLLVGFAIVLLEEDSTPDKAIRAGHQEFARALREEINGFVDLNLRPPDEAEIQVMKDEISQRVRSAIKGELSWYHYWTNHDDQIGFLGGSDTLLTAERIREWSGKGPQVFRSAIRGTQKVYMRLYPFGPIVPVEVEHHYDLFWQIEVKPVELELAASHVALHQSVETAGKNLQDVDTAIAELVSRLDRSQDQERIDVLSELAEKVATARPKAVEALASAWEAFVRARMDERYAQKTLERG
jgi:hypothetical protein